MNSSAKFFHIFCCLFLFLSCSKTNVDLKHDLNIYQNGDIVFRLGDSSVSNLVMIADEQSEYSHVGIIVVENGTPMVIHACPPDLNVISRDNKLKMDSINVFFSINNAVNGALYRYKDCSIAASAANEAKRLYSDGVMFDYNFDINDTTELYCTEFIEYVYEKSGVSIIGNKHHSVDIPGIYIEDCILISDLMSSEQLEIIGSF